MISYLAGKIILKKENFIILDVQGVGYEVFVSGPSMTKMPKSGEILKLFCYLDVGERSLKLFGFFIFEELEFFRILRNISGVGPKAALEISSLGPVEKIKKEIEKGQTQIFESVPGIGKQKARKIILELSGKLKIQEVSLEKPKASFLEDEAFLALVNLGFQKEIAKEALSQLPKDIKGSQERIRRALKYLTP